MKPLHETLIEQHGGPKASRPAAGLGVGETRTIPVGDPAAFEAITAAYMAKVKSGEFKLGPQLTETYLGGGAWLRSFYIDETPKK